MSNTNIPPLKLSGLEPLVVFSESNFINVGERTSITYNLVDDKLMDDLKM
jgi:hypothetical protein